MATSTRKSRRYAIAFLLGDDLSTVSAYQPTRYTRPPVYSWDGSDAYFVALRPGEIAPSEVAEQWNEIGVSYNYVVMRGRV